MKKLLCAILAMALVILPVGGSMVAYADDTEAPVTAFASSSVTATGTSGTVTWTLYSDGELNLAPTSGDEGTLGDPTKRSSVSTINYYWPWHTSGHTDDITSVTVSGTVYAGSSLVSLFEDCSSLTTLDLSGFDTSSVVYMYDMFYDCDSLTELNLSSFDTSNVTSMAYMFAGCDSLTELNLSGFDTSSVVNMYGMFRGCSSLVDLDLSGFDTSSVTNMTEMFLGCSSLQDLDLSGFDTSSVMYMSFIFYGCSSLIDLDLSSFDTSSVTDMTSMFNGCSSLTELDLSDFDTSSVTYMLGMFRGCSSLIDLGLNNFDTSSVTHMNYMFYGCSSLTTLDLSNFDVSVVKYFQNMFQDCTSLSVIYATDWTDEAVKCTTSSDMFSGCISLSGAICYDSDKVNISYANYETGYFTNKEEYFIIGADTNSFAHTSDLMSSYDTDYYSSIKSLMQDADFWSRVHLWTFYYGDWEGSCEGISLSMIFQNEKKLTSLLGNGDYYSLGSPTEGTTLQSVVNYYQLVQFTDAYESTMCLFNGTDSIDLENDSEYYAEDISVFLYYLVKEAQQSDEERTPFLFMYKYKNSSGDVSGHSVVVCGYMEDDEGNYVVQLYDLNSYSLGSRYYYMTVSSDYGSFDYTDANGISLENQWLALQYYSIEDLEDAGWNLIADSATADTSAVTGLLTISTDSAAAGLSTISTGSLTAQVSTMSAVSSDTVHLAISAYEAFTITNAQGQTLSYDGESYSGDMTVYSMKIVGEQSPELYLTVDASDSFVLTDIQDGFRVSAEIDDGYYTVETEGADTVTLSADDGVVISGDAYSFDGGIGVDQDTDAVVCFSGATEGICSISATDEGIVLQADAGCSDAAVEIYSEDTCESSDLEQNVKETVVTYDEINSIVTGETGGSGSGSTDSSDDSSSSGSGSGSSSDDNSSGSSGSGSSSASKKISIAAYTVTLLKTSYTYDGKAKKPAVTVKNGSTTLPASNYQVTYASGCKKIGTYQVTVTGTGNYTGTITTSFKIVPKKVTLKSTTKSTAKQKLTVKWKKGSGSVTKYQIRYRVKGTTKWKTKTVSASKASITLTRLKSGKKYQVQVRAYKKVNGTKYYGSWSKTKTVKVK